MFRSSLLESKSFEHRKNLAKDLEHRFLKLYFGSSGRVIEFGKGLLLEGHREAAQELIRAVGVLGSNMPAGRVINQVTKQFGLSVISAGTDWRSDKLECCRRFHDAERYSDYYYQSRWAMFNLLGAELHFHTTFFSSRIKKVTIRKEVYTFASEEELHDWISKQIVEPVLRGEEPLV